MADTQSFGIVRMLVRADQMDDAMALLKNSGYTARINHVICAEIEDKPNALSRLLGIIEDEQLSVEYIYSCRRTPQGNALMVLRLSEKERGLQALLNHGIRVHSQTEIDQYSIIDNWRKKQDVCQKKRNESGILLESEGYI